MIPSRASDGTPYADIALEQRIEKAYCRMVDHGNTEEGRAALVEMNRLIRSRSAGQVERMPDSVVDKPNGDNYCERIQEAR